MDGYVPVVHRCSFMCTIHKDMTAHIPALTSRGALRPLAFNFYFVLKIILKYKSILMTGLSSEILQVNRYRILVKETFYRHNEHLTYMRTRHDILDSRKKFYKILKHRKKLCWRQAFTVLQAVPDLPIGLAG